MTSNQEDPIEFSEPPSATLGLLYLMVDLEVLGAELQVADDAIGRHSAYRDPVADRLTRAGVHAKKVEGFRAWEETISDLISSNSRDKDHLAKIAAAEKAGLTLLEGLIDELKKRNQQECTTSNLMSNLAA